jgi:hypothetical protein
MHHLGTGKRLCQCSIFRMLHAKPGVITPGPQPSLDTHLVVRLQRLCSRHLLRAGCELADDLARIVLCSVLVKLIDIDLQVLGGLGQAEGVEAAVTCTSMSIHYCPCWCAFGGTRAGGVLLLQPQVQFGQPIRLVIAESKHIM